MIDFSYGNRHIRYSHRNVYVDPVDSLHDLTHYEKYLDSQTIPWAVYIKITNVGKDKYTTKFVLIAEENL